MSPVVVAQSTSELANHNQHPQLSGSSRDITGHSWTGLILLIIMDDYNSSSSVTKRIPILTGLDNYLQWRNAVEDGALVYGALHVLTEDLKERLIRPTEIEEKDGSKVAPASAIVSLCLEVYREWKTWKEKDQKVMGLMRLNVSSGIRMN